MSKVKSNLVDDIKSYLAYCGSELLSATTPPSENFWREEGSKWMDLAPIAYLLGFVVGNSADIERMFSFLKDKLSTSKRNSLSDRRLNQIVLLGMSRRIENRRRVMCEISKRQIQDRKEKEEERVKKISESMKRVKNKGKADPMMAALDRDVRRNIVFFTSLRVRSSPVDYTDGNSDGL